MYQFGIGMKPAVASAAAVSLTFAFAAASGVMQDGKNRISTPPALFMDTI